MILSQCSNFLLLLQSHVLSKNCCWAIWVPNLVKTISGGWRKVKQQLLLKSFQMFTFVSHSAAVLTPCHFCESGNMPRLVLSKCCCQSCTFERNPYPYPYWWEGFHFSLASVGSVHSDVEIYLPCMPALHTTHHLQAALSSHLSLVKKPFSSSRSSYTRASTLPHDNHRTSVWSNKTLCFASISSHRDANMRLVSDLVFTKFIIRTPSSSTGAPGLLVKSWQRVPPGAKKTVRNDNIWVSLFHTANEPFHASDHGRCSISADTYAVFARKFSLLKIFWCYLKYFLSLFFFRQCLAKRTFSLMASPSTKRILAKSWA